MTEQCLAGISHEEGKGKDFPFFCTSHPMQFVGVETLHITSK